MQARTDAAGQVPVALLHLRLRRMPAVDAVRLDPAVGDIAGSCSRITGASSRRQQHDNQKCLQRCQRGISVISMTTLAAATTRLPPQLASTQRLQPCSCRPMARSPKRLRHQQVLHKSQVPGRLCRRTDDNPRPPTLRMMRFRRCVCGQGEPVRKVAAVPTQCQSPGRDPASAGSAAGTSWASLLSRRWSRGAAPSEAEALAQSERTTIPESTEAVLCRTVPNNLSAEAHD